MTKDKWKVTNLSTSALGTGAKLKGGWCYEHVTSDSGTAARQQSTDCGKSSLAVVLPEAKPWRSTGGDVEPKLDGEDVERELDGLDSEPGEHTP